MGWERAMTTLAAGPLVASCLSVPPASDDTEGSSSSATSTSTSTTTSSTTLDSTQGSITDPTAGVTTLLPPTTSDGSTGLTVCPDDWWDCNWVARLRMRLVVDGLGEDLTDVPVMVRLTDFNFVFGVASEEGQDLRFIDDDGNELAYEIEQWNSTESIVWLRLPTVTTSTEGVQLYFGNPLAVAPPADTENDVWSNGYRAVWHMAGTISDSTASNYDCVRMGAAQDGKGLFGDGTSFSGGRVECQHDGLDGLLVNGGTISAWVRPGADQDNGSGRIVDKSSGTTPGGYNLAMRNDESVHFARGHDELGLWTTPGGSVAEDQWTSVAVTYSEGNPQDVLPLFYVNGANVPTNINSSPSGNPDIEAGLPLSIGNIADTENRAYDGVIDEVRLSEVTRSEAWLLFQHLSGEDMVFEYQTVEFL